MRILHGLLGLIRLLRSRKCTLLNSFWHPTEVWKIVDHSGAFAIVLWESHMTSNQLGKYEIQVRSKAKDLNAFWGSGKIFRQLSSNEKPRHNFGICSSSWDIEKIGAVISSSENMVLPSRRYFQNVFDVHLACSEKSFWLEPEVFLHSLKPPDDTSNFFWSHKNINEAPGAAKRFIFFFPIFWPLSILIC